MALLETFFAIAYLAFLLDVDLSDFVIWLVDNHWIVSVGQFSQTGSAVVQLRSAILCFVLLFSV